MYTNTYNVQNSFWRCTLTILALACGLNEEEARRAVNRVIIFFGLNLDYSKHSIAHLPAISVYNAAGSLIDKDDKALWILGFEDVRKDIEKKLNLSIDLDFPVTFVDAPVHTIRDGIIY